MNLGLRDDFMFTIHARASKNVIIARRLLSGAVHNTPSRLTAALRTSIFRLIVTCCSVKSVGNNSHEDLVKIGVTKKESNASCRLTFVVGRLCAVVPTCPVFRKVIAHGHERWARVVCLRVCAVRISEYAQCKK